MLGEVITEPVAGHPITSRTWINSVSSTSGRLSGSFNPSAGARSDPLSPANRAVRKPCYSRWAHTLTPAYRSPGAELAYLLRS